MLTASQGIVLNHIRFSENDLIVKILTKKKGLLSFMVKGGQKKKKKYLQQLMVINITFNYRPNKSINYIKTLELKSIPNKILIDHRKLNIVLFLCEIISRCVKYDCEDLYVYEFIEKSISWLNSDFCSGKFFDLWFLINLTKFLGFAPNYSELEKDSNYVFSPEKGCFILSSNQVVQNNWDCKMSVFLYDFLCINIEDLENFSLSYDEYKGLIENVLNYYSIHVPNFRHEKLASIYTELL